MQNPIESTARVDRMLAMLAEQATEHAILLLSTDRRVLWCSPGAERLFSLPPSKAIGLEFERIFTSEDVQAGISTLEVAIADSAATSEDDRWHVRSDGSRFWSSGALIALRGSNGEVVGFGKILRDRTDMKEQITLLENKLSHALRSDQGKDLLITKVAHELRNVIAGLDIGLRMLAKPPDDEKRGQITDMMGEQLTVVRRLIDDLLEIKRLQAGKGTLHLQDVVVQEALRLLVEQLRPRALEKTIDLQLLHPSEPIVIAADPVRLQQIVSNLIDNALKYTPAGGRIWVKATIEDQVVVIHVEDTGRGIPPEMLSRIFELFTQVEDGVGDGLGIGLALVHELVQLHGGSVQAISKGIGMGSEFSIRLPRRAPESL